MVVATDAASTDKENKQSLHSDMTAVESHRQPRHDKDSARYVLNIYSKAMRECLDKVQLRVQ